MNGLNIPQTFREMCPLWTRRLETYPVDKLYGSTELEDDDDGIIRVLNIDRRDSCIAGEAYGFNEQYYYHRDRHCKACDDFGYDFTSRMAIMSSDHPFQKAIWLQSTRFANTPIPTLQETIDAFTKHFEENHIVDIPKKHLRIPQQVIKK